MPEQFHFYEHIFMSVDRAIEGFMSSSIQESIEIAAHAGRRLLILYVAFWGWCLMRAVVQEPLVDAIARLARITVIGTLACDAAIYHSYVADWLWKTPDALANALSSHEHTATASFLDQAMTDIYTFGQAFWIKAIVDGSSFGVPDLGLTLAGFGIWIVGVVATGYAALLLLLSKMTLSLLLVLGPLAMLSLLFDSTRRYFESWFGMVMNSVLLVTLAAAMIRLMLSILQEYLGDATGAGVTADPAISHALPAIVLCALSSLVFMQIPSIASALGGGMSLSTLNAANWMSAKVSGAIHSARPTQIRREVNMLKADWRITREAFQSLAGSTPERSK